MADLAFDVPSSASCLVDGCLESEDAYVAHLESSEPALPWNRVRAVGFEDGQVVVELADSAGTPRVASLVASAQ